MSRSYATSVVPPTELHTSNGQLFNHPALCQRFFDAYVTQQPIVGLLQTVSIRKCLMLHTCVKGVGSSGFDMARFGNPVSKSIELGTLRLRLPYTAV